MTKKRSKAKGNLGRNMIRNRFKGYHSTHKGERSLAHTSDLDDGQDWARMGNVSITEQGALDAFIETAALAGTEFTAERANARLVTQFDNEALPTRAKVQAKKAAQEENMDFLRIPRRPDWTRSMSKEELHEKERKSFLEWRRGLAELEQTDDILLTPFERNLDFWRQLWRVIERSDVVVQIVDARNPLLFRCTDLEDYVHEIDPKKRNLLLVNKADLLSLEQRKQWGEYFKKNDVEFVFFSAALEKIKLEEEEEAKKKQEQMEQALQDATGNSDEDDEGDEDDEEAEEEVEEDEEQHKEESKLESENAGEVTDKGSDEEDDVEKLVEGLSLEQDDSATNNDTTTTTEQQPTEAEDVLQKVESHELFDVEKLLELFVRLGRAISEKEKPTIGLVGYPNVGKSSSINAMCKSKMVSVSSTPGKTKHFQTILLPQIELCDCPGLVFPNFANTKAELVCNGILPIDQLRDVIPPSTYVAQYIPRDILESRYGISIIQPAEGEDPNRPPTALEFLNAFSFARGFMNARGLPDISRGARLILKDFVKGRLLYCKPPPGYEQIVSETYMYSAPSFTCMDSAAITGPKHNPKYMHKVDEEFFQSKSVNAVHNLPAHKRKPQKNTSKKHNNKNKREKTRRVMVPTHGGY